MKCTSCGDEITDYDSARGFPNLEGECLPCGAILGLDVEGEEPEASECEDGGCGQNWCYCSAEEGIDPSAPPF